MLAYLNNEKIIRFLHALPKYGSKKITSILIVVIFFRFFLKNFVTLIKKVIFVS